LGDAIRAARFLRQPRGLGADVLVEVRPELSALFNSQGNADRAQKLRRFVQAFARPGVELYSLQKRPEAGELDEAGPTAIIDLAPHLRDFADSAAALQHLGLAIMTDTAVAHLAGALGRPVWVLVNRVPYFLWSEVRDGVPWYDSVRLFRPESWTGWDGVFDRAAAALLQAVLGRAS
jgi:hypothetical protein